MPPATPTPGPVVEYVTLTEEELATLIDQAVAEAVAATEQTSSAAAAVASDGAVTAEEAAYVYDYYYYALYYTEYAEDLLNEYYSQYSELAYEMIDELTAIEVELVEMNDNLVEVASTLDDINSALAEGQALAQETITKLQTAAQQAQINATEVKTQAQDMMSQLQVDQQGRLDALSQVQPNDVAATRLEALRSGFAFIDAAKEAFGDTQLTRTELLDIAQLGVNAQAGFEKFGGGGGIGGGPDLSQFTGKFSEITTQFANGQLSQARGNLDDFERALGDRPRGP
jgi:hypothetical protein